MRIARYVFIGLCSLFLLFFCFKFIIDTMNLKEVADILILHTFIGFFVAFLFLIILLRFLRPLILISKSVCKGADGKFNFKIINKPIYHAFDAKMELFLMQPIPHIGADCNVDITPISLHTSKYYFFPQV